jgi:hypothetical protein
MDSFGDGVVEVAEAVRDLVEPRSRRRACDCRLPWAHVADSIASVRPYLTYSAPWCHERAGVRCRAGSKPSARLAASHSSATACSAKSGCPRMGLVRERRLRHEDDERRRIADERAAAERRDAEADHVCLVSNGHAVIRSHPRARRVSAQLDANGFSATEVLAKTTAGCADRRASRNLGAVATGHPCSVHCR